MASTDVAKDPVTDEFSSSALVAFAYAVLRRLDPALVPDEFDPSAIVASGKASIDVKQRLLEHAFRTGGPAPLLAVGMQLHTIATHPIVAVLTRTPDTDVLAEKWARLGRYYHSRNRCAIDTSTPGTWRCEHTSRTGHPSHGENLLVCGVLMGLLQLVGVGNLRCRIGDVDFAASEPSRGRPGRVPMSADRFELRFDDVATDVSDGNAVGPVPEDVTARLRELFGTDVARSWRLTSSAASLGLSSRSLQRALSAADTTFSTVLRERRVTVAAELLRDTDRSLADIGFACGFSDQPHFQREFVRTLNLTPGGYRAL